MYFPRQRMYNSFLRHYGGPLPGTQPVEDLPSQSVTPNVGLRSTKAEEHVVSPPWLPTLGDRMSSPSCAWNLAKKRPHSKKNEKKNGMWPDESDPSGIMDGIFIFISPRRHRHVRMRGMKIRHLGQEDDINHTHAKGR